MKVLMVCSGGMSSAIVVKAIKNEADKKDFPLEIKAVGTSEFEDEVKKDYDLVLIAPQIRHRLEVFRTQAKKLNVPIELIVPMGYTPVGAPKVLEQIKKFQR
ncbi:MULTISPECIES: PTS sugar transporter subunit IIB [Clostridium]|uniref:PTS sugar transporter subunit IIB n=1 Tax=Clostridium brassicae TaxID=2999072 RepID=A0ABT4DCL5_9CLOT|nr:MULTISPECIES: PTS sugar transporter subunit IIB [Clostridium]MCY6960055.1 PTS sugar transporter subunit IIB [Clostridium brassicae]WMJ82190.1 PTS sugar transporter subunit IIB [Clostridium sp. MB40-C1]